MAEEERSKSALFLLCVAGGIAVMGVLFLVIVSQGAPSVFAAVLYMILCCASSLGAFWMMYMVIRYEKKPLPLFLLAFVPYTFVWYYLERVKGKDRVRPEVR